MLARVINQRARSSTVERQVGQWPSSRSTPAASATREVPAIRAIREVPATLESPSRVLRRPHRAGWGLSVVAVVALVVSAVALGGCIPKRQTIEQRATTGPTSQA